MDGSAERQPDVLAELPEAPAPTDADESIGSFGDFLRNRRGRLSPAEAGFPAGGRRRTPGLRREELATLAGISVDYLTRMEQGRETNPSVDVLDALRRALQLSSDEWLHMKNLSKGANCPEACPTAVPDSPLEASTLTMLEQLNPMPAFVLEQTADVTAWNGAYGGLMAATGLFDLDPPNLVRYTFLMPEARSLFPDWDAVAMEQLGNLRAATARWPQDTRFRELVGELAMESSTFANLWACQEVGEKRRGEKHLTHPEAGELNMTFEVLSIPGPSERMLVTYLASDDVTSRSLEELATTGQPNLASEEAPEPGRPATAALQVVR